MAICLEKVEHARRFIPNLRVVSEHVVRGGQPEPEGLRHLKDAGIRTVVSLCSGQSRLVSFFRGSGGSSLDPETERERAAALELGINWVQIPLEVFSEPPTTAIERFADLIGNPDNRPAFVHCLHGRDRTGLMMGVYRIVCEGWDADRAYAEMIECGFDAERTNLSEALFEFARRQSGR